MRTVHILSKTSLEGLKRGLDRFATQVVEVKPVLSEYNLI